MRRMLRRARSALFSAIGSIDSGLEPTDRVAITFDDGPDPIVTPRILEVLARAETSATFFVLTDKALGHPDLIRRMMAEGHEVCLHFDFHDRLTTLPVQVARRRLSSAKAQLEQLVGKVKYFRPPYGGQSLQTFLMARSLGLQVVAWGPVAEDWREQTPRMAADRALGTMRGGDILLLHDAVEVEPGETPPTFDRAQMVELVLKGMRNKALVPTSVGDLLAVSKPRMSPWFN